VPHSGHFSCGLPLHMTTTRDKRRYLNFDGTTTSNNAGIHTYLPVNLLHVQRESHTLFPPVYRLVGATTQGEGVMLVILKLVGISGSLVTQL